MLYNARHCYVDYTNVECRLRCYKDASVSIAGQSSPFISAIKGSGKAQQHFRPSSNTTCFPLAASLCRWLSPKGHHEKHVDFLRSTVNVLIIWWVEYEWCYIDLIFRIFKLHTQRRHHPYLQRILETKRDLKDILKPSYSFGTWFFNFHPAFSCFKQLTPPPNLHENKPSLKRIHWPRPRVSKSPLWRLPSSWCHHQIQSHLPTLFQKWTILGLSVVISNKKWKDG